jgi:outer membrane protein OmpA-like peptidoglycan-associated protein
MPGATIVPIQARISNTLSQHAWLRKTLRWAGGIIIFLLVLAFISWLALPHFVKKIAVEQIQEQLGRKADIGNVSFNPLILKLTVSDFTLYEPDQTTPAVTVKTLIVNASSTSLARRAIVLDEGLMFDPKVHLIRTSADGIGRYNFSDVIDRILAKPKTEGTTPFLLTNLQLQGGDILFDDKVTGKQVEISALNLGVPVVSNLPARVDTFVQPYASATINGAHLALHGRSKPFADSLETSLALDLDQLDVPGYVPFSPVALPLKLRSAKLSTKLDLRFSRIKEQPEILLSGDIKLDDLSLAEKNDAPLFTSRSVQAKIKQINLLNGNSEIDALTIDTPEIWAALDQTNMLNWLRISAPPAAASKPDQKQNPKPSGKALAQATAVAPPVPAGPTFLLSQLNVKNGKLNWSDDYNAAPRQNVQLNNIAIDAQQLSTAANAKPGTLKLSADQAGGGHLQVGAQITPATAAVDAEIQLEKLSLGVYQPYVNKVLAANLDGQLSLHTKLGMAAGQLKLSDLNVDLDDLNLAGKTKTGGAIAVKSIALSNATADTGTRQFQAAALHIKGLAGDVKRDAQGKLNLQQFMLPAAPGKHPAAAAQTAAAKPANGTGAKAPPEWQAGIGEFTIADSKLSYEDNSVTPAFGVQADALKLTVNNASTKLDQPIKIALEARMNKNGKLTIDGGATPQFKTIDLNVNADRVSLAPLQPFFTDYVNITLKRGFLSTKGKLAIVPPLNKQALGIHYIGAAQLSNFDIQDKESSAEFLRWRALNLTAIDANIGKGAPLISIGKVALDNFYARAILSPAGKLNLKGIMVTKDQPAGTSMTDADSKTVAKTTTTVEPVTPAAPAPNAPIIRIGQTVLSGGNINYTDNFVKPNYTANMTGMNGSIGSIASDKPQPAAIDLKGKIDNDAQLTISGSLNPLFKPMFLDIKASANGVELTRMTPYAAKYAGYPIIKGKLSMNVQYKIENQQLVAQNDLRIDQLTFGDHIDGPDATKLPVMLAVALLKDRNGQINLNLPISGSLSDPQFSIGGVIVRVIVNLIAKAVTSPFALINSMFGGDSEELGYVEFAPGSDTLTKDAEQKLEKLTKALNDRPALKLDIIGRVDPIADTNGLRRAALDDKEKALKRRDLKGEGGDALTLTDADRAKYLEAVYKNEKFSKPKNVIGFSKSLPPDEMERLILENTPIGPTELRELALHRADSVRKYLEETAKIPLDRVYLVAPKLTADDIKDKGAATRVDFSLK